MVREPSSPKQENKNANTVEPEQLAPVLSKNKLPYTEDEISQLTAHLVDPSRGTAVSSSTWAQSTLPLLVALVEKALQLAAENCTGAKAGEADEATEPRGSTQQRELFTEENAYLLEQLQLQEGPFFTLPRLWEVLGDPYEYHCNASGELRGEKLQSAIRRLILVSGPPVPPAMPDALL